MAKQVTTFTRAENVPGCPSCGLPPYAYPTEFGFTLRCAGVDHDVTVYADTKDEAYAIWNRRFPKLCRIKNGVCTECGEMDPSAGDAKYCAHCGAMVVDYQ